MKVLKSVNPVQVGCVYLSQPQCQKNGVKSRTIMAASDDHVPRDRTASAANSVGAEPLRQAKSCKVLSP